MIFFTLSWIILLQEYYITLILHKSISKLSLIIQYNFHILLFVCEIYTQFSFFLQ